MDESRSPISISFVTYLNIFPYLLYLAISFKTILQSHLKLISRHRDSLFPYISA